MKIKQKERELEELEERKNIEIQKHEEGMNKLKGRIKEVKEEYRQLMIRMEEDNFLNDLLFQNE